MRILFIGNVILSYNLLKTLIKQKVNLIGAVSTKKSNFNSDFKDITSLCKKNKIPLHYTKKINSNKSVNWIKKKSPDYIFCFGWSQILGEEIISIAKKHVIGFHPSKLPQLRGRHPIIWPIILGAKSTASTFFKINKNIDDGPIIDQKLIRINSNDEAFDLYKKIINKSQKQVMNIIDKIKNNKLSFFKNDKKNKSSLRKRTFEDGEIDWRMSGEAISRLVRALNYPYPGAHLHYKNKIYKIWKIKKIKNMQIVEPGKILFNKKNKPIIKCADSAIQIIKSSPKIVFKDINYL